MARNQTPQRGQFVPRPQGGNPLKATARLLKYFRKYIGQLILVVVCILLSALASVAGSLFLQTLIDDYITPLLGVSNPVFTGLLTAIGIMAIIYAVGVVAGYLYNRIMAVVAQGVQKEIRDEMFSHMQKLPVRYFDQNSHGDIMSRYTNDIDTLRQMLSQSLPQLLSSIITVVSVFCTMLYLSLPMSLIVVVMVCVMLSATKFIAGKSARYFMAQQKALGEVNGFIEETMQGQKVVKVFNHEEKAKEQFDEMNEALEGNSANANALSNILGPVMGNLGNLQYVLLAVIGSAMALGGVSSVTLGTIASFLQMSRNFTQPISQISMQLNSVIMALAGAERIFQLIDEPVETDDGYVTLVNAKWDGDDLKETPERTGIWAWKHPHSDGTVTYTKVTGDVRLNGVDFGYDENKLVLHDITLFAQPGQKVAFVGATGAGKTTITNLINRFYDVADGKVRYDGININKIKKDDLRRSLGIVLQETNLFTGTVRENIRYGNLTASDEEVVAAAQLAGAHEFIEMLPQGYETVIAGDGSSLSQGQRQLLSIARAAVADPPVMILDEATSSIDTRTEAIVQRGMDALMTGRTVFVIAHRLSTVQNSDVIMVLDAGRIIERGSHEDLIAQGGQYYQLYTGAFELE